MILERRLKLPLILRHVGRALVVLLAYNIAVTALFVVYHQRWIGLEDVPLALLGSALAVVVGLRNSASYARWWEARTLWGSAVSSSRSLARGAIAMLQGRESEARAAALVHLQIGWAYALCRALQRQDPRGELEQLLPGDVLSRARGAANVPTALQAEIARFLAEAGRAGALDSTRIGALDRTLCELANAQGGLERIKNTPLPRQFDWFPRVFITVYCLLLPVALVTALGPATAIGSTVIGFAFYLLDQIGLDLEDPFEGTPYDVPMSAIARTIEIDLRQMLRERETPAPLSPKDGVLW
jgi:putative membrane protein